MSSQTTERLLVLEFVVLYFDIELRSKLISNSDRFEVRTRSSARGDFKIQRTRTNFGERAFAVAGPAA